MIGTRLNQLLCLAGVLLTVWGYHLLAVPPDAPYTEMLVRARNGVFSVMGGSGLLMAWLVSR